MVEGDTDTVFHLARFWGRRPLGVSPVTLWELTPLSEALPWMPELQSSLSLSAMFLASIVSHAAFNKGSNLGMIGITAAKYSLVLDMIKDAGDDAPCLQRNVTCAGTSVTEKSKLFQRTLSTRRNALSLKFLHRRHVPPFPSNSKQN